MMNPSAIATICQEKYILYRPLGQGVFSDTYWATQQPSGQPVIIKTLARSWREPADYEQGKEKFLQLSQQLASCQHRHLVPVLDYFEENGQPYIVYEYIPGETLTQLIEFGLIFPPERALHCIYQLSSALKVLHAAGLQHQDVSPKNIILRKDTQDIVLIDYGIVCQPTHNLMMSSSYTAPEQYDAHQDCIPATDIYALSATFYYLLSGTSLPPASERVFNPEIEWQTLPINLSPELKSLIEKGLELNAEQRPQSIRQWLASLSQVKAPSAMPAQKQESVSSTTLSETSGPIGILNPELSTEVLTPTAAPTATSAVFSSDFSTLFIRLRFHWQLIESNLISNSQKWRKRANLPAIKRDIRYFFTVFPELTWNSFRSSSTSMQVLVGGIFMTSLVATSAGIGFGLAIRFNRPVESGSTPLHSEQSFPPRNDWPIVDPADSFLEEDR